MKLWEIEFWTADFRMHGTVQFKAWDPELVATSMMTDWKSAIGEEVYRSSPRQIKWWMFWK